MHRLLLPKASSVAGILLPVALLQVATIGYLDYLTRDFPLLLCYAFPVVLDSWYLKNWGAATIALAAGYARYVAAYYQYASEVERCMSSIEDMLLLLVVGLVVSAARTVLEEEREQSAGRG